MTRDPGLGVLRLTLGGIAGALHFTLSTLHFAFSSLHFALSTEGLAERRST